MSPKKRHGQLYTIMHEIFDIPPDAVAVGVPAKVEHYRYERRETAAGTEPPMEANPGAENLVESSWP